MIKSVDIKICFLILVSFLSYSKISHSQDITGNWFDFEKDQNLKDISFVFVDSTNTLDIDKVKNLPASEFTPLNKFTLKSSSSITYWIYFEINKTIDKKRIPGLLIPKQNHDVEFYKITNDEITKLRTGSFLNGSKNDEVINYSNILNLIPDSTSRYFIKIKNINDEKPDFSLKIVDISKETGFFSRYLALEGFIQGMLWLIIIYGFLLFFLTRDKIYIFYSFFALFISFFFLGCYAQFFKLFRFIPRSIFPYTDIPVFISYIFYIKFIISFVSLKSLSRFWHKTMQFIQLAVLLEVILIIILVTFTEKIILNYTIENIFGSSLIIIFFIFIIRLFKEKDPYSRILAIGSVFQISAALATSLLFVSSFNTGYFIIQQIGIIIELLIFTYGISYRYKMLEKEKQDYQQNLIIQMNENAILSDKVNRELEEKVKERTSEIERNQDKIQTQNIELQRTLNNLIATQQQLIQSEKMASLGELTAGIAHEIQNPLNFVNNFSEVSGELVDEMKNELAVGSWQSAIEIAGDLKQNLEKINHHGKRADSIVKNMLQHSRGTSGQRQPTDINVLCDEFFRLAYHGFRAKDKSFNAKMVTDFDPDIGKINVVPQDIGRVILNLISNAFYAAPLAPEGGFKDPGYRHEPTVWVSTKREGDKVIIKVRDNGPGIPAQILDKIFQPFFTTKPTGEGTGLGLSLAYDIVKAHGGEIKVETKPARAGADGESEGPPAGQAGTIFTIELPINKN